MKKIYFSIVLLSFILSLNSVIAQNYVPFNTRLQSNFQIKGDIELTGNSIINRQTSTITSNTPYTGPGNNNNFNMQYIDIDDDPTTFSSSSADLSIQSLCKKIVYAGLYWSSTYDLEIDGPSLYSDWNQVKFKVPGGNYVDIIADNDDDLIGEEDTIIYPANAGPINGTSNNVPYVCYKNVTNLLQSLTDANGTYFIANQRAKRGSTGGAGGWNLIVIYENPFLSTKNITVFDGLSEIRSGDAPLAIPISGFTTIPVGPVRAKLGFASLEGDRAFVNDRFRINGTAMTIPTRPTTNFFNSTIGNMGRNIPRNPNSSNTLGLDLDLINIPNPGNFVIGNNATSATFSLETGGDTYDPYLFAIAIEVIEPNIFVTHQVTNLSGTDIGNMDVSLCQDLLFKTVFQNIGNDGAFNSSIKVVLPSNIQFDPNTDIMFQSAPGVTLDSYDSLTRTLIFSIPNSLVVQGGASYAISIKAKVVCSCLELDDSCSNEINSESFVSYTGLSSNYFFSEQNNSVSTGECNIGLHTTHNTIVNLESCNTTTVQYLCDPSIVLTAQEGYETYTWNSTTGGTFTPVAGTMDQSVEISELGSYNVQNSITGGACRSINQTFEIRSCIPSNIVFRNGNRLAAAENNETYQWIDCDNNNEPIVGATNQEFEATSPGNYAVIITNGIGNSATSDCVAIVALNTELFDSKNVVIYPNPAKESFRISTKFTVDKIVIYNLLGQIVKSYSGKNEEFFITALDSGTYMVEIVTDKGSVFSKIIKY